MASGLKRDVDRIIRKLGHSEYGCIIGRTNRGHWKVSRPGYQQIIISPDPGDPRSIRNAKADLKRYLDITL